MGMGEGRKMGLEGTSSRGESWLICWRGVCVRSCSLSRVGLSFGRNTFIGIIALGVRGSTRLLTTTGSSLGSETGSALLGLSGTMDRDVKGSLLAADSERVPERVSNTN